MAALSLLMTLSMPARRSHAATLQFLEPGVFVGAGAEDSAAFWANWNRIQAVVPHPDYYLIKQQEEQRRRRELQHLREAEAEARRAAADRARAENPRLFGPLMPRLRPVPQPTLPEPIVSAQAPREWGNAATLLCAPRVVVSGQTVLELMSQGLVEPSTVDLRRLRLDVRAGQAQRRAHENLFCVVRRDRQGDNRDIGRPDNSPQRPVVATFRGPVAPGSMEDDVTVTDAAAIPWAGMLQESAWLREAAEVAAAQAREPWAGMAVESRRLSP